MRPAERPLPFAACRHVGVVGSVNRDTILHADGRRTSSLGGVLFTACALAYLGGGHLRTRLVARVAADLLGPLRELLSVAPGVDTAGLLPLDGPGYECDIRYAPDGTKSEVLRGKVPPLTQAQLGDALAGVDALVVNFITGFEFDLETLQALRQRFGGPILIDVHSLTLGRDASGRRFLRPFEDWRRWVAQADVVQMNELEAASLGAPAPIQELQSWATGLLDLGPVVAVITLGRRGALCAYRTGGTTRHLLQPAAAVPAGSSIDATGCGDVFLAAMTAGLCRGGGVPGALARAAGAAARKCTLTGVDDLRHLATDAFRSP